MAHCTDQMSRQTDKVYPPYPYPTQVSSKHPETERGQNRSGRPLWIRVLQIVKKHFIDFSIKHN